MPRAIYMDYNATAPVRPCARAAVTEALALSGNASSVHGFGRQARKVIEDAREAVARLVGAQPGDVVFTSGGTEANNLALAGSGRKRLLVSAIEHPSVLEAAPQAERIPVTADGVVDLAGLATLLSASAEPALVSVMAANNETGVIQPIAEVVRLARNVGALVHCDAVQAAGRMDLSMASLGVDFLTVSAHKIGGPQGVGALVLCSGLDLAASLRGGGQERRRRAGTENLPGIAGFGAAAAEVLIEVNHSAPLRDALEQKISAVVPMVKFFGRGRDRIGNTSCFALAGLSSETQVMVLDLAGIAISAGSACSSGKVGTSHVLLAMGAGEGEARSAIRVSLGRDTSAEDVDRFVEVWSELAMRPHRAAA